MHGTHCSVQKQFCEAQKSLQQENGLVFRPSINGEDLEQYLKYYPPDFRDRVYSPDVTLFAFLGQALAANGSCQDAVARVRADRIASGLSACSKNTSSYVRARQRIPLVGLENLAKSKAAELDSAMPDRWLWKGRSIKIIDGTTFSADDTLENQTAFPQHTNQKPGLGFPLIRLAILTSLSSGAAIDAAIGPYIGLGELPLAVDLLSSLTANDILVADRYYLTYFFISLVIAKGADFVTRHFDHRQFNVIERRRINKREEILVLKKPRIPHTGWLSQADYESIPETITVRKSRVKIIRTGFRDQWLTVVTTLVDSKIYTKDDLADIYLWRWHVELDIRIIKRQMGLNVIAAKTPEMIAKELWIRLLAYNIIRGIIAMAAKRSSLKPRQISFKGCLGLIASYRSKW